MDVKSYEQFTFSEEAVEADRGYLKEGVSLQVLKYNGAPVSLQLPQYVELVVVSADLGLRADTAAEGRNQTSHPRDRSLRARAALYQRRETGSRKHADRGSDRTGLIEIQHSSAGRLRDLSRRATSYG
jgi:elongation factor P